MKNVFEYNNQLVMDSRLVAEMIGKEHKNLIRDIRGYIDVMLKGTDLNFEGSENIGFTGLKIEPSDFFIPSDYTDSTGRTLPCYLLSKMGCEFVANKLTGTKGVMFTATYVSEFNRMEQLENEKKMIGERSDFGEIASVMKEFRLWAKSMRMPYSQAMEAMTKFFHNTGVPFPQEMCYRAAIQIIPKQIAFWNKDALDS